MALWQYDVKYKTLCIAIRTIFPVVPEVMPLLIVGTNEQAATCNSEHTVWSFNDDTSAASCAESPYWLQDAVFRVQGGTQPFYNYSDCCSRSASCASLNVDDSTSPSPNSAINRSHGLEMFATVSAEQLAVHTDRVTRVRKRVIGTDVLEPQQTAFYLPPDWKYYRL